MTATLTKTERVLDRWFTNDGEVIHFTRDPDEPGDTPTDVAIDRQTWDDLGSPDSITVTIVPGDTLNVDE